MNSEIVTTSISFLALLVSIWAACTSRKSYLSTLKAIFYCNNYKIEPLTNNVTFYINNNGKFVHLKNLVAKTTNVELVKNLPIDIPSGEMYELQVKYKDDSTKIKNSTIKININYLDKDGHSHTCTMCMDKGKVIFEN